MYCDRENSQEVVSFAHHYMLLDLLNDSFIPKGKGFSCKFKELTYLMIAFLLCVNICLFLLLYSLRLFLPIWPTMFKIMKNAISDPTHKKIVIFM